MYQVQHPTTDSIRNAPRNSYPCNSRTVVAYGCAGAVISRANVGANFVSAAIQGTER